jgi:hypothetical protein
VLLAAALVIAVGAAAAFLAWLRTRVKISWPTPGSAVLRVIDRTFLVGGVVLVLGAGVAGVAAWEALSSGNAYGVLGGLLLGGYALGALAIGALVVGLAWHVLRKP